jgi:hypothetical protein
MLKDDKLQVSVTSSTLQTLGQQETIALLSCNTHPELAKGFELTPYICLHLDGCLNLRILHRHLSR